MVVTIGEALGGDFELKAAVLEHFDYLGFGLVGNDDVVGEVG